MAVADLCRNRLSGRIEIIKNLERKQTMGQMEQAAAVCRSFGDGQKVTAAVIRMRRPLREEEAAEAFAVKGRTILRTAVNATGKEDEQANFGHCVVLHLNPQDAEAKTRYRIGKGRGARMGVRRPALEICYLPTGEVMQSTEVIDELADSFQVFRYVVPETGEFLDYQLYVPKMEAGQRCPLVLFMHDLGACSDEKAAPLVQGLGAVTWAEKAHQAKRPCFVLAPCYPRQTANDEYQVTWEVEATVSLVKQLCAEYPIDPARIYGTGQSMGCMMLCEMNLREPELFAGSFLVAGQWDPARMGAVKDQNLWILVSEMDEKAFPIMGACMERVKENGGTVVTGHVDAKAPLEEQNASFRKLSQEKSHIFFTWYEKDSVLPEGAESFPGAFHVNTWVHAYTLEAVQEWLFSCPRCFVSGTLSEQS